MRLIRELDVFSFFSRFLGVRLIRECVLYAQIYGNLNVVALVIHDHASTHVPVQYIQAYIQALPVQLEHTHGMRTLGDWGRFCIAKHVNIPVPYIP